MKITKFTDIIEQLGLGDDFIKHINVIALPTLDEVLTSALLLDVTKKTLLNNLNNVRLVAIDKEIQQHLSRFTTQGNMNAELDKRYEDDLTQKAYMLKLIQIIENLKLDDSREKDSEEFNVDQFIEDCYLLHMSSNISDEALNLLKTKVNETGFNKEELLDGILAKTIWSKNKLNSYTDSPKDMGDKIRINAFKRLGQNESIELGEDLYDSVKEM